MQYLDHAMIQNESEDKKKYPDLSFKYTMEGLREESPRWRKPQD